MASAKVLSRLRKLLALARSGDTHEARSARAKADALMARHGLAEPDADASAPGDVVEIPLGAAGFQEAWKFKLATVAARARGCEALGLRVGARRKVRLVGTRASVGEASELFRFLDRELRRLARSELAGVVAVLRATLPGGVRWTSARYLRYFREGAVDGFAVALLRGRRGSAGGAAAGGQVGVGEAPDPAEGRLARVSPRGGDPGVRERVASYGARELEDGEIDADLDDLAELAYSSGLRQAAGVELPGGSV